MSSDHPSLESELRNLRAAAVDPDFLRRLERCTEGDWHRLSREEERTETALAAARPARAPAALMGRLEAVVADVPFAAPDGPIPFPKPARRYFRPAAAAAVALAGALAALLVPMRDTAAPETAATTPQVDPTPLHRPAPDNEFIPAGYSRDLREASDQGVIWQDRTRPHRVVRVVYIDHITVKDKNGRTYQIDKPRVEYVLVPARTD